MADQLPLSTGSYKPAPFKFRPNPKLDSAAADEGIKALDQATGKKLPSDVLAEIRKLTAKGGKKRKSKKAKKTTKRKSRK